MKLFQRLWNDEAGFVISTELALVATLLVIGLIVGLDTIRVAVVQELGDIGMAIGQLNQSYTYAAITGHSAATAGSDYLDESDLCDAGDQAQLPPGCITIQDQPDEEGLPVSDNQAGSVSN